MVEEQKKLLEMLKEIDAICRKHGIEYYLAGGTCIGALRHKGFLPWDDDMDLYMTRKHWEKFIEVSKYDFPPNRVLLCPELDSTYTNLFGRYCDTSTTALHKHNMYAEEVQDDPCGVIVDILPLDPIPYTEEFMEEYAKKIALYSQLIMPTGGFVHRYMVNPWLYLKYVWKCVWNREKTLKQLHKELFCYDEDQCDYYAMRWGGTPLLFPKEWFQEPTEYLFEDMMAMMPTMNNAYLTMHYGDSWVNVPDIKDREGHVAILRMDKPYAEFRESYRPLLKKSRRRYAKTFLTMFHFFRLLSAPRKEREGHRRLQQQGERIMALMNYSSGERLEMLQKLLADRKIVEMTQILNPYLIRQFHPKYIGREDFPNIMRFNHPVLIESSDAFLEVVVPYCMYANRIARAMRLMEIKEKHSGLSPKLQEYRDDILLFRAAVNDYDMKCYEDSLAKVRQLTSKYADLDPLIKLELRLFLYCKTGKAQRAKELLTKARELFPKDGEYVKYQMDYDALTGQQGDIQDIVRKNYEILQSTNNGIILLAIREQMDALAREYFAVAAEYMDRQQYDAAQEWLNMGKTLYQGDQQERVRLLLNERALLEIEKEKGRGEFARREKARQRILKNYLESENMKKDWRQLYGKLMRQCGYGKKAIQLSLQIRDCAEYSDLVEMKKLFPQKAMTPDMQMVYGDYLYLLGKTGAAVKMYTQVTQSSQPGTMIHYQAKKRAGTASART